MGVGFLSCWSKNQLGLGNQLWQLELSLFFTASVPLSPYPAVFSLGRTPSPGSEMLRIELENVCGPELLRDLLLTQDCTMSLPNFQVPIGSPSPGPETVDFLFSLF